VGQAGSVLSGEYPAACARCGGPHHAVRVIDIVVRPDGASAAACGAADPTVREAFPVIQQEGGDAMSLRGRLSRLEQRVGPRVCPACRDRQGRIAVVDAAERADGTVVPAGELPAPCAACGDAPEQVVLIIETVVPAVDCGP
jgi:hypothetical protein